MNGSVSCTNKLASVGSLLIATLATSVLLVASGGCYAKEPGRPLSENGKPLQLEVMRVTVTSASKTFYGGIVLPDIAATVRSGDSTYNGRVDSSFEQHVPKPGETFLIVEFKVTGVRKTLRLTSKDVYVADGKGKSYPPIAAQFFGDKWYPFDFMTISSDSGNAKQVVFDGITTYTIKSPMKFERWIFSIPTDALDEAVICLQERKYPLTIRK